MSAQDKEKLNEEMEKENMETPEVETAEEVKEETVETTGSEDEVAKLKAELEDWKQSYMRKQADFQNFTKRKEREMEELRKYASEQIITKLLDGVDNLERAVASSSQTKDFDGLVKGVELILGNLRDIMKAEGVEPIVTENAEFNPHEHMAVMVEDSPEHDDNKIIMELQKGYRMKGKVIRPSMVKVCKK